MTLLKMQTSTTGRSLGWTGMSLWKCQSCRRDCVTFTATTEQRNYWGKKCHKKDSYWIFQVSSLMFPSVAWSRHPIRKASSRSYQSIHEHKKSSHTTHNGCWRYKKRKWVALPRPDKDIRPNHSGQFFDRFLAGYCLPKEWTGDYRYKIKCKFQGFLWNLWRSLASLSVAWLTS